jgi:hypothetical protein
MLHLCLLPCWNAGGNICVPNLWPKAAFWILAYLAPLHTQQLNTSRSDVVFTITCSPGSDNVMQGVTNFKVPERVVRFIYVCVAFLQCRGLMCVPATFWILAYLAPLDTQQFTPTISYQHQPYTHQYACERCCEFCFVTCGQHIISTRTPHVGFISLNLETDLDCSAVLCLSSHRPMSGVGRGCSVNAVRHWRWLRCAHTTCPRQNAL